MQITTNAAGKKPLLVFAGPCSIESYEQFRETADCIAGLGLHWIRGGAYKPRKSPHTFQGLGEEGLEILQRVGEETGLKTLTEVVDTGLVERVHECADGLQIGTRNMSNYELLKKIGTVTAQSHKPVLFKRGMAATISEWLTAVDYITDGGNTNIMLCERGIRTFETATRFTLDIAAVPVVHRQSMLPICVDVSHPAGQRDIVPALAKAAVAAGADALMIEIHPDPAHALSDGPQQLTLDGFARLIEELRELADVCGRELR